MSAYTQAKLEAFAEATGVRPANGETRRLLDAMSDAAFDLIKTIELEKSGIRDGNGFWHGSDAMGGTADELVQIIKAYVSHVQAADGRD